MERCLNQPLGVGKQLFSVLIMNEDGIQTRSHSPLCGTERQQTANHCISSSSWLSISEPVPRTLHQHNMNSEQRLQFLISPLIFHQLHLNLRCPDGILGTILISSAAHLQCYLLGRATFWEDVHRWLMTFILCLAGVTMALQRLRSKLQSLPASVDEFQPHFGEGRGSRGLK